MNEAKDQIFEFPPHCIDLAAIKSVVDGGEIIFNSENTE
jgi:hypothetical protein